MLKPLTHLSATLDGIPPASAANVYVLPKDGFNRFMTVKPENM